MSKKVFITILAILVFLFCVACSPDTDNSETRSPDTNKTSDTDNGSSDNGSSDNGSSDNGGSDNGASESGARGSENSLEFASERYDNDLSADITKNTIIRSCREMANFLAAMIPKENQSAFEDYDEDFFNEYALIFCLYWESGGNIQRRVEKIYIDEGKVFIEITGIVPHEILSPEGNFALNDDVYFRFYIIKVKQSDIENIIEAELLQTFTIV